MASAVQPNEADIEKENKYKVSKSPLAAIPDWNPMD
jgi:hypothetical protein